MDTCFPDWNNQIGLEFPVPGHKKPFTSDNDLVELLWQNGELVMQSQSNKNPRHDANNQQQLHLGQDNQQPGENPILNDETLPWPDFPIDVCFEKEFCSSFLPQIEPPHEPARVQKNQAGAHCVVPGPQPPPRFESSGARNITTSGRDLQNIPLERNGQKEGREHTIVTVGSSHCASNQVLANDVDMSWASSSDNIRSSTFDEARAPFHEVTERGTKLERTNTSSSNGSGSSFCKTEDRSSNDGANGLKRKMKDLEESEQRSEATELESAAGNKSSQKSGTARRSRVAQVHNLSERRRRDRINEKMKALQELIPHSTKSDKASMLDEAIEYMKALQLQLQLMWMGSGMAPVTMLPGVGLVGPQTLPAMQNLMRFSRLPFADHAFNAMNQAQMIQNQAQMLHYHNQMQNSGFPEQNAGANCIGFQGFQSSSSQQPMNVFSLGSMMAQQQSHIPAAPPGNGDGSI